MIHVKIEMKIPEQH